MSIELEIILRLLLAAILGIVLGFEREYIGKPAGMRTYALVTLGATLFTIVSQYGFRDTAGTAFDPSRIAAQIVVGIGFLGAGMIILQEGARVRGLTTASGLWVAAAIGMAIGVGMYLVALVTALIAFIVMAVMRKVGIEHWARKEK